jgi:hypothetical protein
MGWQDAPVVSSSWQDAPIVEDKKKPEPVNFAQSVAMGAGRTLDRLAAGARQKTPEPIRSGVDWINSKLGMGSLPSIDPAVQAQNTSIYEGAAKQHPAGAFVGEVAPLAFTANPLAMAALGGAEYGTPTERATRAGMGYAGGKIGQALGAGVSRLFGPNSASIGPKLADEFFQTAGNKWDIPLSVAQRTQSKPAQIVESVVANLPGGAGVMAKAQDRTFGAFNKAVSKTFGENTSAITPEILGAARAKVGSQIGEIAARNTMKVDEPAFNGLVSIGERAKTELTPDQGKIVVTWLDRIMKDVGSDLTLPGTLYKAYDSQLGKLSKSAGGTLGNVLGDLRGTLREAMDRSISPQDAATWAQARRQYLNLMTVADATKAQVGDLPGHFTPARLLQTVNAAQKNAKFGSGNDLAELAQWAKKTLPDKIPNSGTAQRQFYQKLLTSPIGTLGALGGLGYGADQAGIGQEALLGIPLAYATARGMAGAPTSRATEELLKRLGGGLLGQSALTYAP